MQKNRWGSQSEIPNITEKLWPVLPFAGQKESGYQDGSKSDAKFYGPRGLTIDKNGNIYVADYSNHKIRKISNDGKVTTFAGTTKGYKDGKSATAQFDGPWDVSVDNNGNVFVSDYFNDKIRKISADGNVGLVAGNPVGDPTGIFVDGSGKIIVTDGNHKIHKISSQDGSATILAGTTEGYKDGNVKTA